MAKPLKNRDPEPFPEPERIEPLPDQRQLEMECLAALRAEMLSKSTPSAARVAAAKQLLDHVQNSRERGTGNGESDPGTMTLADINAELATH